MLCVRLVFCLYAEDAGIFGQHEMFGDYLKQFSPKDARKALIELFQVLDTKPEDRDPYMEDDLAAFPYVNGGLFADENIEIPRFTEEIVDLLVNKASAGFDWSEISPTIFGAVFESTLNPETRRSGGMHYTSLENIHKVIDPLFLDALKAELEEIKALKVAKTREQRLQEYRKKLSQLTFLDKAVTGLIQRIPQKGLISGIFANGRPTRSYFFALSPEMLNAVGCIIQRTEAVR